MTEFWNTASILYLALVGVSLLAFHVRVLSQIYDLIDDGYDRMNSLVIGALILITIPLAPITSLLGIIQFIIHLILDVSSIEEIRE